jgi:VIT1/CCC1 family predicted Fe2+/Mn2+ transporter
MARERRPLFLRPEPYRHRRLIDAARLIPVFGAFLLIVPPLLLPAGQSGSTSSVVIYLFGLWTLLIVLAALIARHLKSAHGPRREQVGQTSTDIERGG